MRTVRVTEGPLKADVASHLDPTVPTLTVVSVGAWSQILPTLKTLNPPDGVRLAFDSDWHRKPQVRQRIGRLLGGYGKGWSETRPGELGRIGR